MTPHSSPIAALTPGCAAPAGPCSSAVDEATLGHSRSNTSLSLDDPAFARLRPERANPNSMQLNTCRAPETSSLDVERLDPKPLRNLRFHVSGLETGRSTLINPLSSVESAMNLESLTTP
jgi:hypothetical protein